MKTTVIEGRDLRKANSKANVKSIAGINGSAVKAKIEAKSTEENKAKTEAKSEAKPEVKPEQVEQFDKLAETVQKPVLTLEQKIEKVENLKTLIEKRERMEASRKKLTSFVVGANQFSENIVLTDENGNTFKTSNSEVFAKVVHTINTVLVTKISDPDSYREKSKSSFKPLGAVPFGYCSLFNSTNMKTAKTKIGKPKSNSQRMELERLKAQNPCINKLIESLDLVLIKNPKQ